LAGVVSLMLDVKPDLTLDDIRRGLRASARPHVVSGLMGACSSQNPGRCICTTSTCGVGMVDADEALKFAQAEADGQAYQPPVRSTITVDATSVQRALAVASQDRPANAPPVVSKSGSGGGGALDLAGLLGLGGLLLAGLTSRRS
jgi:serine protease